jgi:hypothetical protein
MTIITVLILVRSASVVLCHAAVIPLRFSLHIWFSRLSAVILIDNCLLLVANNGQSSHDFSWQ